MEGLASSTQSVFRELNKKHLGASTVKEINKKRFELTVTDFRKLSGQIEKLQNAIKEQSYGYYELDQKDLSIKLALIVIEGMEDWQWESNKGVKICGEFNYTLQIFNKRENQKMLNKAMENFEI